MVEMRKMKLKSGTEIWVEVEETPAAPTAGEMTPAAKRGKRDEEAVGSFAKALSTIEEVAEEMQAALSRMPQRPDEVTLELGVKFTTEMGIIIAKGGLDTSLKLTLGWKTQH